jgi:hypothetical protein
MVLQEAVLDFPKINTYVVMKLFTNNCLRTGLSYTDKSVFLFALWNI